MKRPLLLALGFAFPLELVNFVVGMPPIDVGIPDNAGWLARLVFYRWVALHWLGFKIAGMFRGDAWLIPSLIFGGYLEIAMLLFLVFFLVNRSRRGRIEVEP